MHLVLQKVVILVVILGLNACASGKKKHLDDYDTDAGVRIPISITSFKNKSAQTENDRCHGWWWFNSDLGSAFQELAIDELSNYKRFSVLERETIHEIYENEVNLINSSGSTPIERGQFEKAKYTISGVVNSFEYCAGDTNVGAASSLLPTALLGIGFDNETATVEVTLRLIDTRTGRILASQKGMGKQSRTGIMGKGEMRNFNLKLGNYSQTSLSDAIQEAIQNALQELLKQARI